LSIRSVRCLPWLSLLVLTSVAAPAIAESAPAPPAYALTQVMQLGPKVTTVTYRDGAVAVIDHPDTHERSYLDLAAGRTFGWTTTSADPDCSTGTFSGNWGDPFGSDNMAGEMMKLGPKATGVETVNGIRSNVWEATSPDAGKVRMWIDAAYGEVVKWVSVGPDAKTTTLLEVKSLTVGKPPHAIFAMPRSCAAAASQPLPPTDAQRIAALTASAPGTYVSASASSSRASSESCSVQFSVVQPTTLAPIAMAYRVAVDASYDPDHPPAYSIGLDAANPGKPFFSGGGLREVTGQVKSGVVSIPNPSNMFSIELAFAGDAGFGSATVYRQCGGKSTARLLYVLKNPAKPSDGGEWVWGPRGP
jgi:hypothetical protein